MLGLGLRKFVSNRIRNESGIREGEKIKVREGKREKEEEED